jgi:hypothetical protein
VTVIQRFGGGLNGILEGEQTHTVMKTTDADEAKSWLGEHGFWDPAKLTTRPFLWVL